MGSRKNLSETKLQVINNIVSCQKIVDSFIHKFSGIFSAFDKREIGQELQQYNLQPFLKKGTTLAVLSIDGKRPDGKKD